MVLKRDNKRFSYDVALSFAGEDRPYVEEVAAALRERRVRVFYDKYEEASLWGKNLYDHLSDVYGKQAKFTVMFVSRYYKERLWTNHERQAAQARAFNENYEYVLPARFDDSEIPGLNTTIAYTNLRTQTPHQLADLIAQKLELSGGGALDGIPAIFLRALEEAAQRHPDAANTNSRHPNFAADAAAKYVDFCVDAYQNMRVLAMPEPVELAHIYTQVRIADRIRSRQNSNETEIVKEIVAARGRTDTSSLNALSVLSRAARCVLLGRPGSGKSTFMKYLLLRELQTEEVDKIPVLIQLNQLDRNNKSISAAIAATFAQAGVSDSVEITKALLEAGSLRVLIDGLDELRLDDRTNVVKDIDAMMIQFRASSFIVTCRTAAYEFWFGDCQHYEVQKFSRRATISFVLRWFRKEKKKGRELLHQILGSARIRDLCSNPLMLTIVCIGFEAGVSLSNNRAEIYKDAIDALLRKWDGSRSVYRDDMYRQLSPKRREDLLADLAARTFVEGQIVINEQLAMKIVRSFLETMPSAKDNEDAGDAEGVLAAIEKQHGILEKRSRSFWAFAHLTFQEYFVAQYLISRDPELRSRVIRKFVHLAEWREVIMLTASLLPNADDFVLEIMLALTKMGYGKFFVQQTEREIRNARLTVYHRDYRGESIFPDEEPQLERPRFRASALGLIEGGYRLTLEELQVALMHFREVVAANTSTPTFDDIIGGALRGWRYSRILDGFTERKQALMADERVPKDKADNDLLLFLQNECPGVILDIQEFMWDSLHLNLWKGVETRIELLTALLTTYGHFEAENQGLAAKLNAVFEPTNMFELTQRRHMFVTAECLEDCEKEVNGILAGLTLGRSEEAFRAWFSGVVEDPGEVPKIIYQFVKDAVLLRVRRAALRNKTESSKLRAFVAGETLAEILSSQAFITPSVRDAAVRTLNNMINDIPPPEGPPTSDVTLSGARALG